MAIHYGGPTWESESCSWVKGVVSKRCTHDPDAIDWLLLDATASDGPGIFHRVSHIQRLDTVGGLALNRARRGRGGPRSLRGRVCLLPERSGNWAKGRAVQANCSTSSLPIQAVP